MENRDNSRTPMQWSDSTNGGFTEENLGSQLIQIIKILM